MGVIKMINCFMMFRVNREIFTVALEKGRLVLIDQSKKPIPVKNEDFIKILNGIANKNIKIIGMGQYGQAIA